MAAGSIKGSAFESVVADVLRGVQELRIPEADLDGKLTEQDRSYLETTIMPSLWYPLASYERLVALLLVSEGRGDPEYLVERGRRAAQRLCDAGLYRQLDASVVQGGARFVPLMESLGPALFQGTEWTVERADDGGHGFRVQATIPDEFPECARLSAQGFIEFFGSRSADDGTRVRCTSSRPRATLMVFAGDPVAAAAPPD